MYFTLLYFVKTDYSLVNQIMAFRQIESCRRRLDQRILSMKILDEKVPIKENLRFSLKRYWYLWLILLVTILFDYLSTAEFVSKYGIKAEANLITRFMMHTFGHDTGNMMGKLLQILSVICMACLSRRIGNFFLLFVIIINSWATIVNSIS